MTDTKAKIEYADTGIPNGLNNSFVPGPKPAANLDTGYAPSPYRLHSPFVDDTNGQLIQDPSNTIFQRTGEYQLTPVTFQQLPLKADYIVAPGIQAPIAHMKHGWSQAYVPEPGMHPLLPITIPFLQLSQPIHQDQVQYAIDKTRAITQTVHRPVKRRMRDVHEGN
jgi:hypothetical protein